MSRSCQIMKVKFLSLSQILQWLSYIYTFSSLCVLKSNEYQIWYFDSEINDFSVFNSCHAFIPKILIKLVSLLVMSCDQNAGVTSLISSTYPTKHRELFVNNSTQKIRTGNGLFHLFQIFFFKERRFRRQWYKASFWNWASSLFLFSVQSLSLTIETQEIITKLSLPMIRCSAWL